MNCKDIAGKPTQPIHHSSFNSYGTDNTVETLNFSFADAIWPDELARLDHLARSVDSLSPAQRTAYLAEKASEAERARAETRALMARISAETKPRQDDDVGSLKSMHLLARMAEIERSEATWARGTALEDGLWDLPCARFLDCHYNGGYDCSAMPEHDYATFMRYLYANGFDAVAHGHRQKVYAVWADLPPGRIWVNTKPPPPVGVQRFCVKCPAGSPAEGCQYVHGNTISRINEPCRFAEKCTGPKRASCIRMHPGETWSADLVIRRAPLPPLSAFLPLLQSLPVVPIVPEIMEPAICCHGNSCRKVILPGVPLGPPRVTKEPAVQKLKCPLGCLCQCCFFCTREVCHGRCGVEHARTSPRGLGITTKAPGGWH
jgi:hypothetical protein